MAEIPDFVAGVMARTGEGDKMFRHHTSGALTGLVE